MCLKLASLSHQGFITPQFIGGYRWLLTRSGWNFIHFVRFGARHLLYSSSPLMSMSTALDRHASDSSDRLFNDHAYHRIHICRSEAQFCFRCFSSDKMYVLNGSTIEPAVSPSFSDRTLPVTVGVRHSFSKVQLDSRRMCVLHSSS
jgi:hypothetical protein